MTQPKININSQTLCLMYHALCAMRCAPCVVRHALCTIRCESYGIIKFMKHCTPRQVPRTAKTLYGNSGRNMIRT